MLSESPRSRHIATGGQALGNHRVPRAMSTQHPDNAMRAPFAAEDVLKGEGEITEAHYVFASLGCDEQMWDYEGKAADVDVVLKLFQQDPGYFQDHVLGRDVFLTLRIPNPAAEQQMRKKLEEALHTIVTAYDLGTSFYGTPTAPIFQVILPFTENAEELFWVDSYFREVVVGKQDHPMSGGQRVRDWLGEYHPETIQVIPLVEDRDGLMAVDRLVEEYVRLLERPLPYLRVFLARSDPALNYGMISAILLAKIGLQRLDALEARLGLPLYPIIGVGGVPFRGNFRPGRVAQVLRAYPSVQTFTVQSSFKFDHDQASVQSAVQEVLAHRRRSPNPIDEQRALEIVDKVTKRYQQQVADLAELVNAMASFVPQRRDRRLHVGLFGYSRQQGEGESEVRLPRAITFAAALYSLGLPPELLGMDALDAEDLAFLRQAIPHMETDLADALRYANEGNVRALLGQQGAQALDRFVQEQDPEHRGFTGLIYDRLRQGFDGDRTRTLVEWAAQARGFLG